jgi:hypothetical protein
MARIVAAMGGYLATITTFPDQEPVVLIPCPSPTRFADPLLMKPLIGNAPANSPTCHVREADANSPPLFC